MKKILGLDLGTNSIGWALIEQDFENRQGKILGLGSRIIPMSQDQLGDFGKGNSISQTAERTRMRSVRRLRERHLLRRQRLLRLLNILGYLPEHYALEIDFEHRLGQFLPEKEPKIAYNNKQFIFKNSFSEMLEDFRKQRPDYLKDEAGNEKLIPYDWTIYFLRKKALTEKIEKEELAWILLNFNQKRGYYQLRGEEEEEFLNKIVEFHSLAITDVKADDQQKGKSEVWYSLVLENGWIYRRSSKIPLYDWKDKVRDFIVTTELNDDGTVKKDKEGREKRSFRAPGEDDWTLLKKKTEQEIEQANETVGAYIYDTLLQNPKQKIRGKLVRTIERKYYKDELRQILKKQSEYHSELQDEEIYNDCVRELYKNNETHQLTLSKRDFVHLFLDDIIFYQRPLKSKKSSITNCTLEYREFTDKEGKRQIQHLKAIPKSHPAYQEFRLWQWIYNLSIYKKDDDTNITKSVLQNTEDYEKLFEFLNNRKDVDQKAVIKYLLANTGLKGKDLNNEIIKYRWNFVEDKLYPCNETHTNIKNRIEKVVNIGNDFLTAETEQQLWHIIYSVTDKTEYEKALKQYAKKHKLDIDSFVENFIKYPPFKSEYGSYSVKAIKKLLPLIRLGKYWEWDNIDHKTKQRIDKIINAEEDSEIRVLVREKASKNELKTPNDFQGLQLWLASYIVYDRHSEATSNDKWNSLEDLSQYLEDFKQHSLRNPIVEQVITETLRVVKDIWAKFGNGAKDYFNEIHVELGREMKNTAEERKSITNLVVENENTNLRIKSLLAELKNDPKIENVRPHSPMQQEILKIFEDGVLKSNIELPDEILKISKSALPTNSELQRYKLWLEQKYRSPYTGKIIPLHKLFTPAYEIEHIIPQSRFFDDSFNNKIICESAVNKLKDNLLGLEFVKKHHGEIIELGIGNESVKIFSEEEYLDFIKQNYLNNRSKRNKLLLDEIPDKMIKRQLNDTRYISKFISALLSNIVRSAHNDDGINSKNVIPGNGKITSRLKQDWGLNDVWNDLILPRFQRMNKLTNTTDFTTYNEKYQKELPTVPIGLSKGFQKKRIDHRHHALDALVIACATRDHVNLLNNLYAKSNERFDLNRKLRKFEKVSYKQPKKGKTVEREVPMDFIKPWENFTEDANNNLESIIVSFKQNLRVINKTTNKYTNWIEKDGKKVKGVVSQTKGDSWAIRKPMHKDTVSGEVKLAWIKVPKGKRLTATRKPIDITFDLKTIESITDTGIQKILKNYLISKENNPELAFTPEGLEEMNKNILIYNDGKLHQPIYKARVFELGSKFPLGQIGNKESKFVEAAKGTNLFFAIYIDNKGKRDYDSIPLNIVIERQKHGLNAVPETNEKGYKLLFHLSPNDLVYAPTLEEIPEIGHKQIDINYIKKVNRVYKMVSSSGKQCFFIKHEVSTPIVYKSEYSALNKMERSIDDLMIKDVCSKIIVDRLGNVIYT